MDTSEDTPYWVLDYLHDSYAREALMFYAFKCHDSNPELSSKIWMLLRDNGIEENE